MDKTRPRKQSRAWAMLIRQVWEVDPLICPKCQGKMKLIAFINKEQAQVIDAILTSLNIQLPDFEEMARGPPKWLQIEEAKEHMAENPESYPEEDIDQSQGMDEDGYFKDPP